jgi:predicted O-linked N-acetylglucosamine transferase (SPINDLY family)
LRRRLAHNGSRTALFDSKRFCRNLEAAYAEMQRLSEAGEEVSPFSIQPAPA